MSTQAALAKVSARTAPLLQAMAPPARIAILLAIGRGEACVCHLEAVLGWRQAYLSQHLMALRRAGLLLDRRAGKYVYYRLKDAGVLALLRDAARLSGLDPRRVEALANPAPGPDCACPYCTPGAIQLEGILP